MSKLSVSEEWMNELGGSSRTTYEKVEERAFDRLQREFEEEDRDCNDFSWVRDMLYIPEEIEEEENEENCYISFTH